MQGLARVRGLGIDFNDSGSHLLQSRERARPFRLPDRCLHSIHHELFEPSIPMFVRLSFGGRENDIHGEQRFVSAVRGASSVRDGEAA
eukprot:448256-Amphidinium_carterae.1